MDGREETHFFDLENITGNDFAGLNLLEGPITENDSLESKSLF